MEALNSACAISVGLSLSENARTTRSPASVSIFAVTSRFCRRASRFCNSDNTTIRSTANTEKENHKTRFRLLPVLNFGFAVPLFPIE